VARHAHSPRAGAWAGVIAARGVAWRPPQRAAVVTSHPNPAIRERRDSGSAHGVHLRQSGVTALIRPFHIRIITLITLAN